MQLEIHLNVTSHSSDNARIYEIHTDPAGGKKDSTVIGRSIAQNLLVKLLDSQAQDKLEMLNNLMNRRG